MPAKIPTAATCQVCNGKPSKYRCPSCPLRYCSVACFKTHKAGSCTASGQDTSKSVHNPATPLRTSNNFSRSDSPLAEVDEISAPLRPLTTVSWPPEPDTAIFTDPLLKEDPKPLRREELMRIATSPQLRSLLSSTNLAQILRILDSLPNPHLRSRTLARLLGVDDESLSKPGGGQLLSQSDSPPPLETLLAAVSGEPAAGGKIEDTDDGGFWIGYTESKEGRMWIGKEEKKIMRMWAGVVCESIDGGQAAGPEWGSGPLEWEL